METEYWHMIFNLLGVIILMVVLFYLLKKVRMVKQQPAKHMKIINIVPIGSKEKVILMEVNKTVLLIGATPSHIETLYVFNELDNMSNRTFESDKFKKFMEMNTAGNKVETMPV